MTVFRELQRRNVFRVAAIYIALAWLLLQVVATVAPMLDLSIGLQRAVLVLLAIGFPVALVMAWALELTPQGVRRDRGLSDAPPSGRGRWDWAVAVLAGVAIAYFLLTRWEPAADRHDEIGRSVAVLPLQNLGDDPDNEAFSAGIHDDLLTHLSRISALATTSRNTVLRYRESPKSTPEIAAELGVAAIVEGGVQRSGDRVRINIQLIDARRDVTLWSETFDRELTATNVFDIQSEIARTIAAKLRATLTEDEKRRLDVVPTRSIDALQTYFIGKRMLEDRTRESLQAALEYFQKVVELDPQFALGWSGIADAYMLMPEYFPSLDVAEIRRKSRQAIEQALAVNPDLPEVRSSLAWDKLIHEYDWTGAETTYREALRQYPRNANVLHWLSHTLSWQGRHDEAIELARRAVEVDPESKMMRTNLAYILVDAGQFDEGLAVAWSMRDSDPEYTAARRNLFLHELRAGRVEDAARTFESYIDAIGADTEAARIIGAMFVDYARNGTVGQITPELIARAQLGTEDLAQVLAFVGDAEGTLEALRVAIDSRSGSRSVLSMGVNGGYDFVRDDPRFQGMLEEIGLTD